jgi:hypothetical protein
MQAPNDLVHLSNDHAGIRAKSLPNCEKFVRPSRHCTDGTLTRQLDNRLRNSQIVFFQIWL